MIIKFNGFIIKTGVRRLKVISYIGYGVVRIMLKGCSKKKVAI